MSCPPAPNRPQIGDRVEARTGSGELRAVGRVVAYSSEPTYDIRADNGETVNWVANLVHPTTEGAAR